jgi:long-chain fatty acid transport protein
MAHIHKQTKILLYVTLSAIVAAQHTYAGGFSLYTEGSAAKIGNFAAGSAADVSDASIGWYNPAGLVLLQKNEVLISGVGVFPVTKISGLSTYNTDSVPPYQQSFTRLPGGEEAAVPAIHVSHPFGKRAVFGLSVVSPYGLSTKWEDDSPVRYAATLTKLTTVDLSPEMGVLLTDHLAFGAGLDLQWANVKFDAVAGSPAALQYIQKFGISPVTPTTYDSSSINEGGSFGVGFHTGLMGIYNQNHTRIGINYQSAVSHRFEGHSTLTGRLADFYLTNPNASYSTEDLFSNYVSLPDFWTISLYQDLTKRWAFLGSVVYSGWSSFKTIELYHVAGYSVESSEQAPINIVTPQNYRDTWRAALGLNYQVNDRLLVRIGGGYDETPTVDAERDIRLPDANRWAFSIGSHYQATHALGFDVGYTYLFALGQSPINKTQIIDELSSVTVNAQAISHAQLAGIQATWIFDAVAKKSKDK